MKGYTDFAAGFLGPEGLGKKRGAQKTFDYEGAIPILKNIIRENPDVIVQLGLREDWNNTSDTLYDGQVSNDGYFYLTSCWATPIINVINDDVEEEIECYKMCEGPSTPSEEWFERLRNEVES